MATKHSHHSLDPTRRCPEQALAWVAVLTATSTLTQ